MPEITVDEASAGLLAELWQGWNHEHPDDPRTPEQLVQDSIRRVHRGFFGLRPDDWAGPLDPTGPFRKWASDRRAEVLLRQIDATTFHLAQPFRFAAPAQEPREIPEGNVTDLASVPGFLTWLVPRYGRHTLAALFHDHLQHVDDVSSEDADTMFRDAMGQTGVPRARRWLMWSAVALRTEVKKSGSALRAARGVIWALLLAALSLALWGWISWRLVTCPSWRNLGWSVLLVAGATVLPLVAAVVFGRRYGIGALTGVALVYVTVPILVVLASIGTYLAVDWAVELTVPRKDRKPVLASNLASADRRP